MEHLIRAAELLEESEQGRSMEWRQLQAQQASVHALIALVQRVDQLIEAQMPQAGVQHAQVADPAPPPS